MCYKDTFRFQRLLMCCFGFSLFELNQILILNTILQEGLYKCDVIFLSYKHSTYGMVIYITIFLIKAKGNKRKRKSSLHKFKLFEIQINRVCDILVGTSVKIHFSSLYHNFAQQFNAKIV